MNSNTRGHVNIWIVLALAVFSAVVLADTQFNDSEGATDAPTNEYILSILTEGAAPPSDEALPPIDNSTDAILEPPAEEPVIIETPNNFTETVLETAQSEAAAIAGFEITASGSISQAVIDEVDKNGYADVLITLKVPDKPVQMASLASDVVPSLKEMRQEAADYMQEAVALAQDNFLDELYDTGGSFSPLSEESDFKLKTRYSVLGILHANVDKKALIKILDNSYLASVSLNGIKERSLAESIPLINANDTWAQQIDGIHINGTGQTVCVIDTGIDVNHPAFGGSWGNVIVGGHEYIDDGDTSVECTASNPSPCNDLDGHGTNCAGIVASRDATYRGVAPGAKIVAIKAYTTGIGFYDSDTLAGIDWCLANSSSLNISVISMSLGGDEYASACDTANLGFSAAINHAVNDFGVLVAVASGNNGWTAAISAPACIENATSVGAVYDSDVGVAPEEGYVYCLNGEPCTITCSDDTTAADQVTCFSNSDSDQLDLMAPGAHIQGPSIDGAYGEDGSMDGTSQATPHVAGAAAIIFQYAELNGLSMTPARVEEILEDTGVTVTTVAGSYKRIDLLAAINSMDVTGPSITINSAQNTTLTTTSHTFNVTLNETGNCTLNLNGSSYANSTSGTNITWAKTLGQGNYTNINYTCQNVDNLSTTSSTYWLKVDTIAPNVTWDWADINRTITTTSTNVCVNTTETADSCVFNFNATGSYTNGTDGTRFCYNKTPLSDGNYTNVNVTCYDLAGLSGNSSNVWVDVDAAVFTATINSAQNTTITSTTHVFSVNMTKTGNCTLYINGTAFANGTTGLQNNLTNTSMTEGNHSVYWICQRSAQNSTTPTYWLKVDTIAPNVTWDWADINRTITTTSTNVCVNTTETADSCVFNFNATGSYTNGTDGTRFCYNKTPLSDGNYTNVNVTCYDLAGLSGNSSNVWVDVDAAVFTVTINSIQNTTVNDTTQVFNVSMNKAGNCTLYLNATSYANTTSGFLNLWTVSGLSETNHSVYYTCQKASQTTTTHTYWLKVDATPPSITITDIGGDTSAPYNTSDTSPAVIATTNEAAACRASTDGDETYDEMIDDVNCTGTTTHTCQFGTMADGTYMFYVACVDSWGNKNNASNNANASATINATLPDLQVVSIIFSIDDPEEGEGITITANITNNGATNANGFTVALLVDNVEEDTAILSVAGSSSNTVSFTWAPPGVATYNITIAADSEANINESMEGNNNLFETITSHAVEEDDNGGGTTHHHGTSSSSIWSSGTGTLPTPPPETQPQIVQVSGEILGDSFVLGITDSDGTPGQGEVKVTKPDGTVIMAQIAGGEITLPLGSPGTWIFEYTDPSGKTVIKTIIVAAAPVVQPPVAPPVVPVNPPVAPPVVQPPVQQPGPDNTWMWIVLVLIVAIGGFLFMKNRMSNKGEMVRIGR